MKKRNVNALLLKKTTISNLVIGGMDNDSDNACPSAVSCESVCFCIPLANGEAPSPVDTAYCESPVGSPVANAPANADTYAAG